MPGSQLESLKNLLFVHTLSPGPGVGLDRPGTCLYLPGVAPFLSLVLKTTGSSVHIQLRWKITNKQRKLAADSGLSQAPLCSKRPISPMWRPPVGAGENPQSASALLWLPGPICDRGPSQHTIPCPHFHVPCPRH